MVDPHDTLSWASLCFVNALITCFHFLFSFMFVLRVKFVIHLIEKKSLSVEAMALKDINKT